MVNDDAGNIYFQFIYNSIQDLKKLIFTDTSGKQIIIPNNVNNRGIIKLNPEGKIKWFAEIIREPGDSNSANLIFEFIISKVNPGRIKVIGTTRKSIIFDTIKLNIASNSNKYYTFYAECDSNGKWVSAKIIGFGGIWMTDPIVEDKKGNLYFSKPLHKTYEVINGPILQIPPRKTCPWFGKLDAKGNFLWGKSLIDKADSFYTYNNYINVDNKDNVVFSGSISYTELNSKGNKASKHYTYIQKFNSNGNLLYNTLYRGELYNNYSFFNHFNSLGYNHLYTKMRTDTAGNIYVAGNFKDSLNFGSTFIYNNDNKSTFIAKYDSTLKLLWVKNSSFYLGGCNDFTLDDSSNIYIGGISQNNLTFNSITIPQNRSPYIFKFNKDGIAKWAYAAKPLSYGGTLQINVDDCGNILTRGGYGGFSNYVIGNGLDISYIKFDHLYTQYYIKPDNNYNNTNGYYLAKHSQYSLKIRTKSFCKFDSLEAIAEPKYVSFTWQFGKGKILKGKKVAYFPDSAGWYHVKLTAVTSKGCVKHLTDSFYFFKPFDTEDKTEIYHATVTSQNTAKITFRPLLKAIKYNIYRSENGNNSQLISGTKDSIFTDSSADCSTYSYTYKILAVDRCGNTLEADNHAKTILLQGENHNNQYAEIKWSPYEIWKNGVKQYCIEIKDTAGNWNALSCNQNNNLALRDDDFIDVNQNERCYRIRALENNGNNQLSLSNELCLPYIPTIWIPNAFSPNNDGLNDTFKILTIALAEYKLTIYNRWGQQVFTSDDLNKNWTGKSGNENLPEGEYIYTLQAKGFNKENIYKQGYILLIR